MNSEKKTTMHKQIIEFCKKYPGWMRSSFLIRSETTEGYIGQSGDRRARELVKTQNNPAGILERKRGRELLAEGIEKDAFGYEIERTNAYFRLIGGLKLPEKVKIEKVEAPKLEYRIEEIDRNTVRRVLINQT